MKKNKEYRVFSRVLSHLSWATFYHVCEERDKEYKEVLAAKRLIEGFGGDDVKPMFYDWAWHIEFTVYHTGYDCNRYYTVDSSHGYENDYHETNKSHVNARIGTAEFERDCTLRCDYHAYQMFRRYGNGVLVWGLEPDDFDDYRSNGNIANIPYDVAVKLWRDLGKCLSHIIDEAIAHKKVVL